jgi:DNA-binding NarL/FixJ family response regulator/AraC-like DNA-binding protein
MIHVLIAEDEPSSLRRVKRLIEQLDPAFSVVATASDGEEALKRMEEVRCDVVFTDIRMPVMDGLQLMDEVRSKYPGCMLVVLSGYQDFGYASHAVRAQALDYLVKPVSEEALGPLLKRIKQAYTQGRQSRLRQELAASINKASSRAQREPGADGKDDALHLALLCAGPLAPSENPEMCPGAALWSHLTLEDMVAQTLGEQATFTWEFMGDTSAERILILQLQRDAQEWAKYLHESVMARSELPVTCVCLSGAVPLEAVGAALKSLRKILARRIRIGRSLFIQVDPADLEEDPREEAGMFELTKQERMALMEGGWSAAQRRELFSRFEGEQWTQRRIHRLFMDAISVLEASAPDERRPEFMQLREVVTESVSSALSLRALEDDLQSIGWFGPGPQRTRPAEREGVAAEIKEYLSAHYSQHITNQTLSSVFGYVPSYISLLFRRAFDISPLDYLTEVRLRHARQLIETCPGILMRDVAERVGFRSQHHFSRTFKRYVGLSPTDYKS